MVDRCKLLILIAVCSSEGKRTRYIQDGESLKKMPVDIWSDVPEVIITNNNIQFIPKYAFVNNLKIQHLHLHGNQIKSIDSEAFKGLIDLQELHLRSNDLTTIQNNTFVDLHKLIYLGLSHNKLKTLKQSMFNGLIALRNLCLEHNHISIIEYRTFQELTNLTMLYLNRNQISKTSPCIFIGLNKLQFLSLQWNRLKLLEPYSFASVVNNQETDGIEINLGNNPLNLNQIPWSLFGEDLYANYRVAKLKINLRAHGSKRVCTPKICWIYNLFREEWDKLNIDCFTQDQLLTARNCWVKKISETCACQARLMKSCPKEGKANAFTEHEFVRMLVLLNKKERNGFQQICNTLFTNFNMGVYFYTFCLCGGCFYCISSTKKNDKEVVV